MQPPRFRYFILNKPYGMESQFKSPYPGPLLHDLPFNFPEGTHALGRLDKESEGLLLLTTNKKITALLFQSKVPHKRTYLVQVKHIVSSQTLAQLRAGVQIRIKGGGLYATRPCDILLVESPREIFPPPRNFHPNQATTWLQITLTEGKYHQIRKMVAKAGHRCMRLIRISIEDLLLGRLQPGEVREVNEDVFFAQLNLERSSRDCRF
jgi:23S rRNA pseudouridine2457 synthase